MKKLGLTRKRPEQILDEFLSALPPKVDIAGIIGLLVQRLTEKNQVLERDFSGARAKIAELENELAEMKRQFAAGEEQRMRMAQRIEELKKAVPSRAKFQRKVFSVRR